MLEILTAAEMKQTEAAAIAAGISGIQLMSAAGAAAAESIISHYQPCPVLVLCGPGNNGGDGFIIAQKLKEARWSVRLACLVKKTALKGDAATAASGWKGDIENLNSNLSVHQTGLIIDAVFGTGFGKDSQGTLDPEIALLFDKIRARKIPVVAIDVPTGVNATTGRADPATLSAALTISFCRKKFAHVLLPSLTLCGKLVVADIGISDAMVAAQNTACLENHPALWLKNFPLPTIEGHKYTRGHVVVYGGEKRTGAACLAAHAAQKIGTGAVTIAAPDQAWPVYSGYRASLMVDACNNVNDFRSILRDERRNTVILGPGAGADDKLRQSVDAALTVNKSGVLDADVFTAYHNNPKELFARLSPRWVLTPHEGEFEKIFGTLEGSKPERAQKAAKTANAIVLLKGADTVIAAPDGAAVINTGAPPTLATAGSGDVLSGFIAGLIAQGMSPFMAAAAAVWLHGEAAADYGLGLVAEDIISLLPQELISLFQNE